MQLKVVEEIPYDCGQDIVRISQKVMVELGIWFGDPVILENNGIKITSFVYPAITEESIIKIGKQIRDKLKIQIGDKIEISNKEVKK